MRSLSRHALRTSHREQGSVLIVALIFLMILTMIVLTMLATGTLEERMAANDRNRQISLQSAEAMLRYVEENVITRAPFQPDFVPTQFNADCTNGLCSQRTNNGAGPRWETINWSSNTQTRTFPDDDVALANLPSQPRYVIEILAPPTSRGGGSGSGGCAPGTVNIIIRGIGFDNAVAIVQGTYRFEPSTCGS